MSSQRGEAVIIKVGNGGGPETFTQLGGLTVTRMRLDQQRFDASALGSGAWRALMGNAGICSLSISGSGRFTDSASEETLRANAFAGNVRNYQLLFGNGDMIAGAFLIESYERSGEMDTAEQYAITLESAGTVTFTAG